MTYSHQTQAEQPINLAITGIEITFPGCHGMPAYEHLTYTGSLPAGQPTPGNRSGTVDLAIEVAREAWRDAGTPVDAVLLSSCLAPTGRSPAGFWRQAVTLAAGPAGLLLPEMILQAGSILVQPQVGAVVLALSDGNNAAAVVLRYLSAAQDSGDRIYATILGVSAASGAVQNPDDAGLQTCKTALAQANVQPDMIGYLEICDPWDGGVEPPGFAVLARAFQTREPGMTCALGHPSAPLSVAGGLEGLDSLIKVSVCLHRRMIPAMPGWDRPTDPDLWKDTPFYIPTEPRTWFLHSKPAQRLAAISCKGPEGSTSLLVLSESDTHRSFTGTALSRFSFYLFPLAAPDKAGLLQRLEALKGRLSGGSSLLEIARENFRMYQAEQNLPYAACVLGHDLAETQREIDFAVKGISGAFDRQGDWQTPLGSFFTTHPLGQECGIAFVYPGAFGSYVGLGRDVFYLFPQLYERVTAMVTDVGEAIRENLLYPRSRQALTKTEIEAIEARLGTDPLAMLTSGISLAIIYTLILREVFDLHPDFAFGYSLGEISLMIAMGVWGNSDQASEALHASPLFHTRLAGPQNAVREYWGLPAADEETGGAPLWANFVLMAAPEAVKPLLASEPRVYLTHINTPRQVVIGGDPAGCQRVINALHCTHLKAPFDYALHCQPMQSEYDALVKLHSWPIQSRPDVALFSAVGSQEFEIEQSAIADRLSRALTTSVDFPGLIRAVYDRGARLFIELGAGSNCARWVDDTLSSSPHAAMAINRKGLDDQACILRLMARLTSLRVPLDLSPLYF